MAKGRGQKKRETKKPKADKIQVKSDTTFLRPQPVGAKPPTKESTR